LMMRRWFAEFKKDNFSGKLAEAKKLLAHSFPGVSEKWPSDSFPPSTER
jgi:hypothetical protein